jgi:hypothetical protein
METEKEEPVQDKEREQRDDDKDGPDRDDHGHPHPVPPPHRGSSSTPVWHPKDTIDMLLSDWKEANLRTVALVYPQFEAIESQPASGASLAWEGVLRPFNDCRELGFILDDLRMDRPVQVQAGTLFHDADCTACHRPIPFLDKLNPAEAHFRIAVLAYLQKRHPRHSQDRYRSRNTNFHSITT